MGPFSLSAIAASLARRSSSPGASAGDDPHAAVALVLRELGEEAEILLIRRAEHPDDPWSGHMAFPGGRKDESDESTLAAAIREAREEVSVDLVEEGTLLGRLDSLPAMARGRRAGLTIAPFVFAYTGRGPTSVDEREVAEALWVPLGPLARGEGAGTMPYNHEGTVFELPCLRVEGRVVWGLTYQMLQMFFAALRGG